MPHPKSPILPSYETREVKFAENQPEFTMLPALSAPPPNGNVLTRWEFTEVERAAIAGGADLLLAVSTYGQPLQPILLMVPVTDNDALLLGASLDII